MRQLARYLKHNFWENRFCLRSKITVEGRVTFEEQNSKIIRTHSEKKERLMGKTLRFLSQKRNLFGDVLMKGNLDLIFGVKLI